MVVIRHHTLRTLVASSSQYPKQWTTYPTTAHVSWIRTCGLWKHSFWILKIDTTGIQQPNTIPKFNSQGATSNHSNTPTIPKTGVTGFLRVPHNGGGSSVWTFLLHLLEGLALWTATLTLTSERVSTNRRSPIAGWFMRENPMNMDDLGVPPWLRKPLSGKWVEIGVAAKFVTIVDGEHDASPVGCGVPYFWTNHDKLVHFCIRDVKENQAFTSQPIPSWMVQLIARGHLDHYTSIQYGTIKLVVPMSGTSNLPARAGHSKFAAFCSLVGSMFIPKPSQTHTLNLWCFYEF